MTATLQHCPASDVPPPRQSSGALIFTAERDGGEDIISVARKNYADRNLTIVGAIGCVERAAGGVETDIASKLVAQLFGENGSIRERRG